METAQVGVVLGEEHGRITFAVESAGRSHLTVLDEHTCLPASCREPESWADRLRLPRPRVAEPERRQQMQRRGVRSSIGDRDANQQVVGGRLRVFDDDVEVAVLVEDSGVDKLELGFTPAAPLILVDQPPVGELGLRILVETLHVGVGRRRVEIEVIVLDVLAVVSLWAGQSEEPLLENRVSLVPQSKREADALVVIRDAEDPVLAPAIGAGASVIMGKVVPGRPVGRIVLSDCAPLALRQVRSPPPPVGSASLCFSETSLLRSHGLAATSQNTLIAPFAEVSLSKSSW